jgi:hypothetical protein
VILPSCKILYLSPDNFDPVTTALIFLRVTYDPEGDGEEAGLYMTLIKVKSDFQNNILVNHMVGVPIYFSWCHIDPAGCDHNI